MGMYFNQQQRNTRLHDRLSQQLDKHLAEPKTPIKNSAVLTEKPIVSFRITLAIVLTSGGCMAVLLALLERQNPNAIASPLHARYIALLGLTSIVIGCALLVIRRHHKTPRS